MPPVLDETRLAHAAAAGDGQAFSQLYEEYESKVFNFCLRLCGTSEDAADATQDAFVKVLQRLPKLQGKELNFGAYLFTAARNASYDVIGKRKRADSVDEIPEYGATSFMADERAAAISEPEKAAMVGALQASVQAANAQLPERQREALALRELEELSYDEIAEIMEMNRNSVAQLISRARISLRDQLQGDALASIATKSGECEKALPLIAMREDGQLDDRDDAAWLSVHLKECETCKVAVEAMSEAGVSYRAWAPIVPMAWLWKETMAKAADATGSDWEELIERGRVKQASAGARTGAKGFSLKRLGLAFAVAVLTGLVVAAVVIGVDDPPPDPAVAAVDEALTTPLPAAGVEPKTADKSDPQEPPTTISTPTISTPSVVPTSPSRGSAKPKKRKKQTNTPTTSTPVVTPMPTTSTPATPTPTTSTPTTTTPAIACSQHPVGSTAWQACCRTNPNSAACARSSSAPRFYTREFN